MYNLISLHHQSVDCDLYVMVDGLRVVSNFFSLDFLVVKSIVAFLSVTSSLANKYNVEKTFKRT